jgi:O-antigen/teichoic acid export membrane protein
MSEEPFSISASLRWIGVSQVARILLRLVGVAILARLLAPADYGLMAMAGAVTAFAGVLRDMGTGAALIQRERLTPELVDAVFWFNVSLGLLLMVAIAALAPLMAAWFHEPRLLVLLLVLAPTFPIASVAIAQRAMLERDARFRVLAVMEVATSCVALLVAIVFAWGGAGVYALVAQGIAAAIGSTILLWWISNWRPSGRPRSRALRDLLGFSGNLFIFNLTNYFHRNADTMLIGRFLGSSSLGNYNLAYQVLLFPLQNLTFVVNRAMLPAYSRQQLNREALAQHYLSTLRLIAIVTAPLMGLLWVLREPFVMVMFGKQWLPAVGIIAWLAPVGFLQSIVSTSGSVMSAAGNTKVLRNMGFLGVPMFVCSFLIGLRWGAVGVAAAYCIANVVWIFPVMEVTMRQLGKSSVPAFVAWSKPTVVASIGVLSVWVLQGTTAWAHMESIARLAWGGALGLSITCAGFWVFCKPEIYQLLHGFVPKPRVSRHHGS